MKAYLEEIIDRALQKCQLKFKKENIQLEKPKIKEQGDYASNIALILGKNNKLSPLSLAQTIRDQVLALDHKKALEKIQVAPPGFINFFIVENYWHDFIKEILDKKDKFGDSNYFKGRKVLLEFVSANPTGPLHIGHGRWAVVGDNLARILASTGNKVTKEFYVNDSGQQVENLLLSVKARLKNETPPPDGYHGNYISALADKFKNQAGKKDLKKLLVQEMLLQQKETLKKIEVEFNHWFSEEDLHKKGLVKKAVNKLTSLDKTFVQDQAIWFKAQAEGDDKDRVLIKADNTPTYFAADIAYHLYKFERKYDLLINIWGTDHHGYVARIKHALSALGLDSNKLKVILGQLVALYRGKELVRMSKRTGEMVTLDEVIEEIGKDATRFFLSMNDVHTHLDFDLELAKNKSQENPVYYVQYAHARICSILKEAEKQKLKSSKNKNDFALLKEEAEKNLIRQISRLPEEIIHSAQLFTPHILTIYARETAALFHNFYHQHRVITYDKQITYARLALCEATRITLKNVLKLLGISAPERM